MLDRVAKVGRTLRRERAAELPRIAARHIVKIPPPDTDTPFRRSFRGYRQAPALAERSRLQSEPELAEVATTVGAPTAVTHCLVKHALGHTTTVVGDADEGLLTFPTDADLNYRRACIDAVVNEVCN